MTEYGKLKDILGNIHPLDRLWLEKARERTSQLVMPHRALGRLHEISERLCGIRQTLTPALDRKAILVMAGDHGVVDEGVSAYPQIVTGEMVKTFLRGGAAINALARFVGAEVKVVDMGIIPDLEWPGEQGGPGLLSKKVARGTLNMAKGPAMTARQAEESILTGFGLAAGLFEQGVDILGTGDMGIGNTTPSAAIGLAITGRTAGEMVGRGTGLDDEGLKIKISAIERAIAINRPDPRDGLGLLSKIGGFEIGGIAGLILAGAYCRRPVVIDGLISTAGALIAQTLCPTVSDYIFAGHCSEEPGHKHMLSHLGLYPILDLGMRLGEGTGGALAMSVMEGAVRAFSEVQTFDQAAVSGKL